MNQYPVLVVAAERHGPVSGRPRKLQGPRAAHG